MSEHACTGNCSWYGLPHVHADIPIPLSAFLTVSVMVDADGWVYGEGRRRD